MCSWPDDVVASRGSISTHTRIHPHVQTSLMQSCSAAQRRGHIKAWAPSHASVAQRSGLLRTTPSFTSDHYTPSKADLNIAHCSLSPIISPARPCQPVFSHRCSAVIVGRALVSCHSCLGCHPCFASVLLKDSRGTCAVFRRLRRAFCPLQSSPVLSSPLQRLRVRSVIRAFCHSSRSWKEVQGGSPTLRPISFHFLAHSAVSQPSSRYQTTHATYKRTPPLLLVTPTDQLNCLPATVPITSPPRHSGRLPPATSSIYPLS